MTTNQGLAPLQQKLMDCIRMLEGLPASDPWRTQLQELLGRIERREKLVAVFGAFSAGKSSLINALLGDNALVVSPNPTTAAVTQVQSTNSSSDAYARVTAKTENQLWDDVQLALGHLHKSSATLTDAIALCSSFRMTDFAPHARKYVTFLKAVAEGYEVMQSRLGTSWPIGEAELRQFTAEERFACYIHRVDLSHSAPFLAEGTILVDTPGVDSIHRRHTDVAFHYMQNADAIVFVLYYTHAFSRADKDFLSQLAEVQDVVGSDKLFVVINAVDLATSSDEREAVRERVERELRQLGVRKPRVFELSSQLSFAACQLEKDPSDGRFQGLVRQRLGLTPDSPVPDVNTLQEIAGVRAFSQSLQATVFEQSVAFATEAVQRQLEAIGRSVEEVYRHKTEQATADESALRAWREAQLALADELRDGRGATANAMADARRSLDAEWDELVYHMGERIRLRFPALFREAFHPGRFRGGNEKLQLQDASQELTEVLSRQIDAECRTFGLRARQQAQQALQRWTSLLRERLEDAHVENVVVQRFDESEWPVPELTRRAHLNWDSLRPYYRYFSSPKQFFEGGGQQEMLKQSEPPMLSLASTELAELTSALRADVTAELGRQAGELATAAVAQLHQAPVEIPGAADLEKWRYAVSWFQAAW